MDTASGIIITASWIIFIVYWFVSALKVKVIAEKQSLSSALAHRIPVSLAAILLTFHNLPAPLNRWLIPHTDYAQIIGVFWCLLGLFITIWARRTLAGNWSSDVTFKQGHELVRKGPYRFVRHPIYTGLLAMWLGTAVDVGQLRCWLSLVIVFIGFWIKLSQEERLLMRHFPEAYPVYRKQVKALVPFLF